MTYRINPYISFVESRLFPQFVEHAVFHRLTGDLLQSGDSSVERTGSEASAAHMLDILEHGVSVLRAVGEAREHQQLRVGKMGAARIRCYVSRTTHNVVVR